MPVQYEPFLTFEEPHCIWDVDLTQRNLEYLNSIDPSYFNYAANVHKPYLDAKDERVIQHAAVAIRTTYSHSLETLFALIGSALQAPHCTVGWMVRYDNKQLRGLVDGIHHRRSISTVFDLPTTSWGDIANLLVPFENIEQRKRFGQLWNGLAEDFLDKKREDEYNSIKHGLRIASGGFAVAIGLQTYPDIPALPEAMEPLGGSIFGSSYYRVEIVQHRPNFQVRRQCLNWNPHNLLAAISLVCLSIGNIVSFLKHQNGSNPGQLYYPADEAAFEAPWRYGVGVIASDMDRQVVASSVTPLTREQIRLTCQPKPPAST